MKIQPIVEGHGEVAAVPVLLRRLRDVFGDYSVDVNSPIRRKRGEIVQESALRKSIQLARIQPDCGAILVLFDSDDDCPKELGPTLQSWASDEASPIPCAVVMAHREYEAWFLAAIESLRGIRGVRPDAESHANPEQPRGAKGQFEVRLEEGMSYSETADQAALTHALDLGRVFGTSRSFRKLVSTFGRIMADMGAEGVAWPPDEWLDNTVSDS